MTVLRRRLNRVLKFENAIVPEERTSKPDFGEIQRLRAQIKRHIGLPVAQFCGTKPEFDAKHGLIYKLLKTNATRLKNSTLCSHDVAYWLRDHKHPTAALWIVRLAGPFYGSISRNQLLQWLKTHEHKKVMQTVYKWTKKWGFKDTERTRTIVACPKSVEEARELYKNSSFETAQAKHIYGNQLLKEISLLDSIQPAEFWVFFRTLNKDVITFQIMLGAMIKHNALRAYRDEIWHLAERHEKAHNIVIDAKMKETYQRVKCLPRDRPKVEPQNNT